MEHNGSLPFLRAMRLFQFCVGSSAVFFFLLVAGQLFSGTSIVYTGLMSALLGPGASRHVLPVCKSKLALCWQQCVTTCNEKLTFGRRSRTGMFFHT